MDQPTALAASLVDESCPLCSSPIPLGTWAVVTGRWSFYHVECAVQLAWVPSDGEALVMSWGRP